MKQKTKELFVNVKQKLLGFFRNDWQLKLVSLLLAIVVWFLICEYVDPDTDTTVNNIAISVDYEGSVPANEGLGIMTAIEETVSVRVSGSRDTIALMNPGKITASVDLSNVTRSGEYDLPVKIDVGGQNLKLLEQSVETVKVRFDENTVSNVKVNVKVTGGVPEGYILEEPTMLNNFVTVTGPKAIVDTIDSAQVEIVQETFAETNTFNCSYTFVDKDGAVVPKTFLQVNAETIDVTVTVVKEKTVPITVSIVNSSGGLDSAFCTAKVEPETITITGNAEVVDKINSIDLGVIDVSERTDNFETSIAVVLPNGVKNVNNVETVKVSVTFNDVQTKTIRVTQISLQNLPDGTDAKIQETGISIKVRGIAEDLKQLNENNVSIVADVRNQVLPSGANRLTAVVTYPDDLKVGTVGKYQLTVVVS